MVFICRQCRQTFLVRIIQGEKKTNRIFLVQITGDGLRRCRDDTEDLGLQSGRSHAS